jgi:large subunit ribosomal protein L11
VFEFEVKSPPASYLLKRAAEVAKGSGETGREPVGSVSREQVEQIAREKMEDLNAKDLEAAVLMIEGTARSCGIEVEQ